MESFRTSGSFIVTEKCTLKCAYCFENHDRVCSEDMTEEVAAAAVELLFEEAFRKPSNRNVHIMLFGGEPLMRPDICDIILRKADELRKKTNIPVTASIITNGTIMNDEIELYIWRWKSMMPFSIQVSLDGCKEAHDLYRVRADGTGSFDQIARNIPIFESFGQYTLHGCLNKMTMPLLYKSYRYFVDVFKHNGAIWYMPVHSEEWDENDVKIYDEQFSMIYEHETNTLGTVSRYSPIDKLLGGKKDFHPCRNCGAGDSFISFSPNGDIYPCHNFAFSKEVRPDLENPLVGNVLTVPFENQKVLDMFAEATNTKTGCADCPNTKCYRCYADNWTHNGSIFDQIGKGGYRCELSGVERKYQLKAVEWAQKHAKQNKGACDCGTKKDDKSDMILQALGEMQNITINLDNRLLKLEGGGA